eukprot:7219230-Prymnesium_polylepis.1
MLAASVAAPSALLERDDFGSSVSTFCMGTTQRRERRVHGGDGRRKPTTTERVRRATDTHAMG